MSSGSVVSPSGQATATVTGCARHQPLLDWLGKGEFLPANSRWMHIVEKYFCDQNKVEEHICSNVLFALAGYDAAQFNLVSVDGRRGDRCTDRMSAWAGEQHAVEECWARDTPK